MVLFSVKVSKDATLDTAAFKAYNFQQPWFSHKGNSYNVIGKNVIQFSKYRDEWEILLITQYYSFLKLL